MRKMENNNSIILELNPLLEKLRENPVANNSENYYFESFDKTKIFYRLWRPKTVIKKIIIVAHGMGGHGEFFVLLADKLVEHEIMVIAPDYRNHGHSEGKKGDFKKFRDLLKDLLFLLQNCSHLQKALEMDFCLFANKRALHDQLLL